MVGGREGDSRIKIFDSEADVGHAGMWMEPCC